MTVIFENESGDDLDLDLEKIAREVIEGTLDHMECPWETSVSVLITTADEIHHMNLSFRDTDRATDVLSFPMTEFPAPGDFSISEEEQADCFDPDSGELLLGDIVICAEKVRAQAQEYGHSVRREYAFLLTHSMLHLMGFDHMTPQDAAVMEGKQREILDALGITRDI